MASGVALSLAENELLNQLFDKMEANAVEEAVGAKPSDDDMRRTSALKIQAIRSVRRELKSLSKDKTNPVPEPIA